MQWIAGQHAAGCDPMMVADPWQWAAKHRSNDRDCAAPDGKPATGQERQRDREEREQFSFLLVGDPGEADASQYAVVDALESAGDKIAFVMIGSDVIYPAGDVNDYGNAFFLPYRHWVEAGVPILAFPGNHDWYDGLNGFMYTFCGAEALPPTAYRWTSYTIAERLAKAIWRSSSRPDRRGLRELRDGDPNLHPPRRPPRPVQPGPYFMIDTEHLRIVAIDTGITGILDRDQGEWLRCVSQSPKPKLLLTGKPIYVNNEYHAGRIEWTEDGMAGPTVDDIVRDPRHNYVAAIGCDVHNYQRYCVRLRPRDGGPPQNEPEDQRQIQYVVAGGSGAYLGATHKIDKIDMRPEKTKDFPKDVYPVEERDFRCYPLRGDSVAYYAKSFGKYVRWRGLLSLLVPIAALGSYFGLQAIDWEQLFLRHVQLNDVIHVGGDQFRVWEAALASVGTLVAVGLFALLIAAVVSAAPRGYRTFASLTLASAAVLGALALLDGAGWWHNLWEVVLVTLGVVLAPVVAALVGYYYRGFGPRFTQDLLIALTAMTLVALIFEIGSGDSPEEVLGWVAAMLAVLALATTLLGAIRRLSMGWGIYRWYRWLVALLMLGGVIALWDKWDSWIFPTVGIAAAVVGLVVALAVLAVIAISGGLSPLFHRGGLGGDGIDPDEAVREVANRYDLDAGENALPDVPRYGKTSTVSPQTRRIVDFLLTDPGNKRRLLDRVVSEVGDSNKPPFFKSFLRLNVRKMGGCAELEIQCFGVTGWKQDADNPPLEDCVRIPLVSLAGPEPRRRLCRISLARRSTRQPERIGDE
jgi:hypothetical protein